MVNKLSNALREVLNTPEVQRQFKLGSIIPTYATPADYRENLRRNLSKYERATKLAKLGAPTN